MVDIVRNPTRPVRIGTVTIGDGQPIAVQSMTATQTQDCRPPSARCAIWQRRAPMSCASPSISKGCRGAGRNSQADDGQSRRSICRRTIGWDRSGAARRQAPLQPRPPVSPRARKAVAGQGEVPCRCGKRQRLCHSRRRQLRQRRSGQEGKVRSGRFDLADARKRLRTLRAARLARLHALLRVAQGFRSGEGDRSQPPLRREAARRAAAPGRHRSRPAARRHHQNAHRVRATHQPRHRRHDSRFAHGAEPSQAEEIAAGRAILADIAAGRVRSVVDYGLPTLNIISCPSCSRVENEAFVELAAEVKEMTALRQRAQDHDRRDGLPRERPRRNRRRRPRPVVRPELRQSQTPQRGSWARFRTTKSCRAFGKSSMC